MLVTQQRYRLVTRSDFDGLVCAVLLKELDIIDDIKFVHPKDMQDGKIEITPRDITTNLPYVKGAHLAFDHHASEALRNFEVSEDKYIIDAAAPSAARVVYEYYGGASSFPSISPALMAAVDKADSAQYSVEEILHPQGWTLLNFLMDSRTGLGRFRSFRISNYQLMMKLIDYCRNHEIDEILELADIKERVGLYREQETKFKQQLLRCSQIYNNLVVLDLREEEAIHVGNRFMLYALFPSCNISIHVLWGRQQQNTVFAVGKSILKRTSHTNIGDLMLEFGGGGHENAGTCQVDNDEAQAVLQALIAQITTDG